MVELHFISKKFHIMVLLCAVAHTMSYRIIVLFEWIWNENR